MEELIKLLLTKEVLIPAAAAVTFVEALNWKTSDSVSKRKYAAFATIAIAILVSWIWSLTQDTISHGDGLWRGVLSAMVATLGYNTIKAALVNLPFIGKKNGNLNI